MRLPRILVLVVVLSLTLVPSVAFAEKPTGFDNNGNATGQTADTGFNEFGYNYSARIFSGLADGSDRNLDGKVWGDPAYANDRLVMKWNAAWDACNAAGNDDPVACAGAWTSNEWNGKVEGGSGSVWHYKFVWLSAPCGPDGTELSDGGYCIWGHYETIMDQGVDPESGPGHTWWAHANPAGYGSYP